MDKQHMTVAQARKLLGAKTDYRLAQLIGRNRASVSRWGRMVPESALEDVGKALKKLNSATLADVVAKVRV